PIAPFCPPDVTGLSKALPERGHKVGPLGGGGGIEDSDHRHRRLLRARRERPRDRRAAEQRDELAALHSTTSSARPSNGSGTVRPSALAAFMLIAISTLVTCWTGRAAGFSPFTNPPAAAPGLC